MKPIDHLEESKCLSNNQNLKMKVAFLSLSENKISAEEANYLGKLPLIQCPTLTSPTQNDHFARVQGHSPSAVVDFQALPTCLVCLAHDLCGVIRHEIYKRSKILKLKTTILKNVSNSLNKEIFDSKWALLNCRML